MAVTEATDCQPGIRPDTDGADGAVRSSRTVPCTHPEVRPAPSMARKRSTVSPSAVIDAVAPEVADDQVEPPSVEVSYS